jgi:hypothetical protein
MNDTNHTYCKDSNEAIAWANAYQGPTPVFVRFRSGMATAIATKDVSKGRETTKHDVASFNRREEAMLAAEIINGR